MNSTVHLQNKLEKPLIIWQAHEGNLSGANIAMLEYIDELQSIYRSHVILPHEGSMCKALYKRYVPFSIIPQYGWAGRIPAWNLIMRSRRYVREQIAVMSIVQLLKHTSATIVCTNTLIPYVSAKAAYILRMPHVWWIHEYGEEDFGFRIGHGSPSRAYNKMQKWSKLIICNSKSVTKKFKALLPAVNVQCVYQPVSWSKTAQCMNNTLVSGYLMFGQISESKGHLDVLEAVLKAKKLGVDVELTIKGPCDQTAYLTALKKFVIDHHLERQVRIEEGFFPKEEVIPQFKTLIVASRSEAFGRVIVEANKAGLYVLVKNSGGAPELVNCSNGLIYNNIEELCAVFTGKILLPKDSPKPTYSTEIEINNLKKMLLAIK